MLVFLFDSKAFCLVCVMHKGVCVHERVMCVFMMRTQRFRSAFRQFSVPYLLIQKSLTESIAH